MQEKIVLIGAGSAVFTRGLVADTIRMGWEGELCLVDIDPAALAVAEGLARKMLAAGGSPLRLAANTDRRAVLDGATVVICTIGVGGRRAWERDVFIPRAHGIYQPVGDTVMPGGSSRALRMIPAMVGVARDVLDLCPQALFFNYGNPMSAVCRGVRKATGADMVGLCHGVIDVARRLAKLLDVPLEEFQYDAVGINHLTWFTALKANGADLMPRLMDLARERAAAVAAPAPAAPADPFTWQLTALFGAFPAVLDRHVTEFFPHLFAGRNAYYGKTLGLEAFSFEGTIEGGDRGFADMRRMALGPEPLPADYLKRIGGEHEQVLDIVQSLRRGANRIYSVNVPNRGQVPNLPAEAVIECPASTQGGRLQPLFQPPLSPGLAGTLAGRFQWVETIVEAALEGSHGKFVQALVLDGAVASVAAAERLADELLAAQAEYLPQFAAVR